MLKAATFRQLKTLHTVAKLGSVSRAAEELRLTQPAESMQIRLLEDGAGTPLMQRVGRGIQLTAAGEILARYALEILDLWKGAADDLAALQGRVIVLFVQIMAVVARRATCSKARQFGGFRTIVGSASH